MSTQSQRRKPKNTWRNIPEKDRNILWGRAAARCSFPNCRIVLVEPASSEDDEATFGQAAHIVAHSQGGPRFSPDFPADRLDRYENLLLLCGNHHAIVDRQPNTYTVDDLHAWKAEHEAWILTRTEPDRYVPAKWHIIAQEDVPQIDLTEIENAVAPDLPAGPVEHLLINHEPNGWDLAAQEQKNRLNELIHSVAPSERRFAVFSLTRIALATHLGFIFSDRCRLTAFQYHRDSGSWQWPTPANWTNDLLEPIWTNLRETGRGPVVLRVSLSATVEDRHVQEVVPNAIADVHLSVRAPSVTWLKEPQQLEALGTWFRKVLSSIREQLTGRCDSIHFLYAGPTPGAIAFGRAVNPRMNPPVQLYEYHQGRTPNYVPALTLRGE